MLVILKKRLKWNGTYLYAQDRRKYNIWREESLACLSAISDRPMYKVIPRKQVAIKPANEK